MTTESMNFDRTQLTIIGYGLSRNTDQGARIAQLATFQSGAEYKAWVRAWKAQWHALVAEIRATKADLRQKNAHLYTDMPAQMMKLVQLGAEARGMLAVRAAGKAARPAWTAPAQTA